jgi:hypothetical protein
MNEPIDIHVDNLHSINAGTLGAITAGNLSAYAPSDVTVTIPPGLPAGTVITLTVTVGPAGTVEVSTPPVAAPRKPYMGKRIHE